LIKILEKDGIKFIRQKGSHRFYEKIIDGERVVIPVPVHSGRELKKGTLSHILKKAKINREQLRYLLSVTFILILFYKSISRHITAQK
jgi:predicted RNA binding protein YcfA (HicA-like mRNA interferase family)